MAKDYQYIMELLRKHPTVSLWDEELRRILLGERDAILLQLGSSDEYVRVILSSSIDKAIAQSTFHEALRNVIQSWQPSSLDKEDYVMRLFGLIGSFTPYPGFIKVLDFLQRWRGFGPSRTRYAGDKDVRLSALSVLEAYYKTASPLMTENAFAAYIKVLQQHLQYPQYSGYSARRLVELDIIKLEDEQIKYLIDHTPDCLNGLLTLILDPNRRWMASNELTQLYMHCLSLGRGMALRFEEELYLYGSKLEHLQEGPVVRIDNDELRLSPDPELYISTGRYPEPEDQILLLDDKVATFAAGK